MKDNARRATGRNGRGDGARTSALTISRAGVQIRVSARACAAHGGTHGGVHHRVACWCSSRSSSRRVARPAERTRRAKDEAYHAHVITAEAIERSGATDAWEVLKRLSTTARTQEAYDGEPQRLHPKRGHGSLVSAR